MENWLNQIGSILIVSCMQTIKLLKIRNDCVSEFVCRILAAQIFGANFPSFQHTIDGIHNGIAVRVQVDVSQQFGAAQQHCRWIGYIFANSFRECVSCALESNQIFNGMNHICFFCSLTGSNTHVSAE